MTVRGKFYVAGDPAHLILATTPRLTWWCVSKESHPGDLGFLWIKAVGMKLVFEFIDFRDDEALCKSYGMATGNVRIITTLEKPITFKSMQLHRVLSKTVAVRRRFQARYFDIEPDSLEALCELIPNCKGEAI